MFAAGTACHLERLICIVGTDPGLCSPEGTHRDLDQCPNQQCGLWRHTFLMALHDEPDHLCSAGAAVPIATSRRQSLGRWGSQTFTTCISLIHNHIALLMMPAASGYSSTVTSRLQSWDGGTRRLSPPVALALQVRGRESLRNECVCTYSC